MSALTESILEEACLEWFANLGYEVNDSAVKILGDEILREIARDLVSSVKANLSIDWNLKESARAKLRVIVKRILRKHGYPPDKAESATATVLAQTELLCEKWQ